MMSAEAILEQSIQSLELKFHNLREKEKLISEMENKIDFLHTVLANIKVDTTYTEERISALEEEVRLLWAASRKNNFDIHILESKAQSTDGKIKAVTSKVQKMEGIVTEQWIQIQQLDQALMITEIRSLEAQRRATSSRCTYLKLIQGICGHYLSKHSGGLERHLYSKDSVLHSYVSHVFSQWKKTTAAVRKHHHELQRIVKQGMEMNELTAFFAHQEVIFFVASSLIVFPLWVAWMLLLAQIS
ncbi:myosin heavy chain-like protein [Thalictrum thalictroides]|uniref:Myosin heavy chain-like protein n=1 Tax=Thalictrum thalictroides TaxID=46969 RepID=A0A7J6WRA5_THATH|nr:myosin heavy chain-like protein [Thalictrum thalictroides]